MVAMLASRCGVPAQRDGGPGGGGHRGLRVVRAGWAAAAGEPLASGCTPAGRLAGEGQECLFQGGPAQGQPADLQASGGQPGRHGGKDSGPVGDRQDDPARCLIDRLVPPCRAPPARPPAAAGPGRAGTAGPAGLPGPGLELAGGAAGDDLAVVDDDDRPGEPFGFLDVLGGQQQAGALGGQVAQDLPQRQPAAGSRPVVGSSRNSTGGAASRLAATSRRRRIPRSRCAPAGRRRRPGRAARSVPRRAGAPAGGRGRRAGRS